MPALRRGRGTAHDPQGDAAGRRLGGKVRGPPPPAAADGDGAWDGYYGERKRVRRRPRARPRKRSQLVSGSAGTFSAGPQLRARDGQADLSRLRPGPGHRRDHAGGHGHGADRARPRGDVSLSERTVHGLRVVIDRDQCVGFGDCVKEAPEGFKLDDETVAVVVAPQAVERERVLRAGDACPLGAVTVYDETGAPIVPRPT